ncbi:hypothetical protein BJX96DRAFT_151727 [Aspergillus floccosus]
MSVLPRWFVGRRGYTGGAWRSRTPFPLVSGDGPDLYSVVIFLGAVRSSTSFSFVATLWANGLHLIGQKLIQAITIKRGCSSLGGWAVCLASINSVATLSAPWGLRLVRGPDERNFFSRVTKRCNPDTRRYTTVTHVSPCQLQLKQLPSRSVHFLL